MKKALLFLAIGCAAQFATVEPAALARDEKRGAEMDAKIKPLFDWVEKNVPEDQIIALLNYTNYYAQYQMQSLISADLKREGERLKITNGPKEEIKNLIEMFNHSENLKYFFQKKASQSLPQEIVSAIKKQVGDIAIGAVTMKKQSGVFASHYLEVAFVFNKLGEYIQSNYDIITGRKNPAKKSCIPGGPAID